MGVTIGGHGATGGYYWGHYRGLLLGFTIGVPFGVTRGQRSLTGRQLRSRGGEEEAAARPHVEEEEEEDEGQRGQEEPRNRQSLNGLQARWGHTARHGG